MLSKEINYVGKPLRRIEEKGKRCLRVGAAERRAISDVIAPSASLQKEDWGGGV
jgi:hypothetical protein